MTHCLLVLALFGTLPEGLSTADTVVMADKVSFVGAVVPAEVSLGGDVRIDLYYKVDAPLSRDILSFVHLESRENGCRLVQDRRPPAAVDGIIHHQVRIAVPSKGNCKAGRLELYTGLYNRRTRARLKVIRPPALADRIYAGYLTLKEGKGASDAREAFSPGDMAFEETMSLFRPWWGYIFGWLLAILLALGLRRYTRKLDDTPPTIWLPDRKRTRRAILSACVLIIGVPLMLSILAGIDFIKDDAYISFRYSQNLVAGEGLVFNAGEHVEGFTNFLWVLLLAPFEALNLDLFQVTEILGTGLVAGLVYYMTRTVILRQGAGRDLSYLWAGVWIATSSSVALWATSGMEQPLAMFLPVASAYLLWRDWREEDPPGAVASGVLMGLGCLTRPEVHLIGVLLGLPLVFRTLKTRTLDRTTKSWFAGLLMITVPAHLFRYLYYGSLVPNTFYVKTGSSDLIMLAGLKKLREMFDFNHLGALFLLTPFAFMDRRRMLEKQIMLAVALGFMIYIVQVGVDEMRWHRLYLPALPFLVMLAAIGLHNLVRALVGWTTSRPAQITALAIGWIVVGAAATIDLQFTIKQRSGFNGRGDLSGNYHPDMGKFITRHERPGALVAFQDMGSTPYHAPDIKFLDFIGLVDSTVARARDRHGLHAFLTTEAHRNQAAYNKEMQAYFYERSPEWVILTTYIHGDMNGIARRFSRRPEPRSLGRAVGGNSYQFGIYNKRFRENYVHVRTWPRSRSYYLSLFRRRDLWKKTPGEVVLDAVPAGLGGVKATFSRGLELLGSELQTEAIERHEFFLTTWWRVPGPMERDLTFFTHVERTGYRHPYDALPGDWMYPANRWKKGQIVEHRALVQIPPNLRPGDYDVFIGVYRRTTGKRLPIVTGPHDGRQRLKVGRLHVAPLRPPFDHLIPKTDVAEQRKYPDRIVSGRPESPK